MAIPVFMTSSTDKAYPGPCLLYSVVVSPAVSQTWSVTIWDSTGHASGQVLNINGVSGTTPSALEFIFKGMEFRTAVSVVLTQVTDVTLEVG